LRNKEEKLRKISQITHLIYFQILVIKKTMKDKTKNNFNKEIKIFNNNNNNKKYNLN